MNLILQAAAYARRAHGDQTRKYNGRPYVEHPARVAARVSLHPRATESMVVAAWLHDIAEDTDLGLADIAARFGDQVAGLVGELTGTSNVSPLSRPERKALDRDHLARASWEAKIIKLLDRIDNLGELKNAPDEFASTYVAESLLLAEAVGDADLALKRELLELAREHTSG